MRRCSIQPNGDARIRLGAIYPKDIVEHVCRAAASRVAVGAVERRRSKRSVMEGVADKVDEKLRRVSKCDNSIRMVVSRWVRRVNPVRYSTQVVVEDVDYRRRASARIDLPNVVIECVAVWIG